MILELTSKVLSFRYVFLGKLFGRQTVHIVQVVDEVAY
jgi:hypothetical protein